MKIETFELPFNGVKAAPLLQPDPKELVKYIIKGWLIIHDAQKTGIRYIPDPRLWLNDFILIMAKPDWKTVFCHYAELAALQNDNRETLTRTLRRAFMIEGIEDKISNEIADTVYRL